jgi:hypothetical protein
VTMPRSTRPLISRRQVLRSGAATGAVAALGTTAVGSLVLGAERASVPGLDRSLAAEPIAEIAQPELRVDRSTPPLTRVGEAAAQVAGDDASLGGPSAGSTSPASTVVATEVDVEPFEVIGVRFATGVAPSERIVRMRVRRDGAWDDWRHLHADGAHAPDPTEAPADGAWTNPLWVGGADGYELELPADATDVEVAVVRETDVVAGYAQVPTVISFASQPAIRPRSAWVARSVGAIPVADTIVAAIIHHSDNTNDYSLSQVPSIIRGIQAFHIDGQGWSDIAYNFMVDRFGNIWEARAGGVAKAVIGGHSYGHNTRTVGICYIGNLINSSAPPAVVDAISRLVAWKLGLHGTDPRGQVWYTDYDGNTKLLNSVSGHKDVRGTACPGRLYDNLATIRRDARVLQQPFPDVPVDAYYQAAVVWSLLIGITTGVGGTNRFEPDAPVTRAQMATFLHRMADLAPPTLPNRFPDVPPYTFYSTAVRWIDEVGITTGVGNTGLFQPGAWVTRGQVATFLHRLAGSPAPSGSSGFSDVRSGAYYADAVAWMAQNGITTGASGTNRYEPEVPVTRAEVVTFLFRLAQTPQAWSGPVPSTVLF